MLPPMDNGNDKLTTWLLGFEEKITAEDLKALDGANRDWIRLNVASFMENYSGNFDFLVDLAVKGGPYTIGQTKGILNCMRADAQRERKEASSFQLTPGSFHLGHDGFVYRIVDPKMGGKPYAKRLGENEWVYEGRKPMFDGTMDETTELDSDKLMDMGLRMGICIVCAAQLTDPKSLTLGFGPTCCKNQTGKTQLQMIKLKGKEGELKERRAIAKANERTS